MSQPNNIPPMGPGNEGRLNEERLVAYLEGRLTPQEQHEVEQWLGAEGMESDAIEGLQQMPAADRNASVTGLNYKLQRSLARNHRRKRRGGTGNNVVVAVCVILLLALVAFCVLAFFMK